MRLLERQNVSQNTFADYDINPAIASALADAGIINPFPIQALTLPVALEGRDIIGQAKTGTGKTLGFGIPVLQSVVGPKDEGFSDLQAPGAPQALIVLPTRELCKQVADDLRVAGKGLSARILDIYGGVGFDTQIDALKRGVEVVVGTPGRLIDLTNRRVLDLSHVKTVVLDEADEMLDLGFLPDVETILSKVSPTRHSMLFSATMPGPVVALARRFMRQPTHIRANDPDDDSATVKQVKQFAYRTHPMNKVEVMSRILQAEGRGRTIIFVKTKRTAARLTEELTERGFAVGALHGDLGQGAREQALRAFRNGKVDVLVATDVAARGIDVHDVTHVVNYQSPEDDKTYVHRIGRTARAGAKGTAVTFVDWDALPRWGLISKALELDLANPPETYHTSDHLYTDLGIPTDVTGRLPRAKRTRKGLDAEELEDLGGSDRPKGGKSKDDRGKKSGGGKGKGNRSRGSSSKNQSENATPGDDKPRKPRKRTRRRVNKPE
ncbi:MAG: DEAD/DEAH box helicase [Scrofimicrobium sp.]